MRPSARGTLRGGNEAAGSSVCEPQGRSRAARMLGFVLPSLGWTRAPWRVQVTEACGPRDSVVCFLCAARAAPATSAAPVCPLGHRPPRAKAPVGQLSPLGFWRTVRSFRLLTRSAYAAYQPPPFLSRPPRLPRSPPRGGRPRGFSDGQRMQVALAGLPPIAPRDSPRLLNPGRKHRRR